ncbi:hypothetical protein CASFOL_000229 [Castilleja foliolosa]|uniref:non-specific serine/threonine protein kinase n=1 Tax=Castilleja foliolosa TaxID=1961234 RepID=A0ABD3ENE0_9LAMI
MGLLGFCFFALLMLQTVAAEQKTLDQEVDAIKNVFYHWGLGSKLNLSVDPCSNPPKIDTNNPGFDCDCTGSVCHITHLKIYALDVVGEIPQALFNLTELMDLNLGQNVINGSIPRDIGKLSKMQYLSLGINNLTGPVPAELGNLTNLISLSFGSNKLHGTLPPELGKLTSLEQLYIDSSGVSGEIPQELSNWNKTLKTLWASDTNFTGKIPEFLGSFTQLADLRLEGTNLNGPIPSSFGALTKLEELRIGDLGGDVYSSLDFVENMTSLFTLSLRNCRIGGQIEEKLSSLQNLAILDLSFNNLTGPIPASFQNLTSLQFLYLGSNSLSGEFTLTSDIISSSNSSFIAIDVSFNPLTGNISLHNKNIAINVVGTSINDPNLDEKAARMLRCLQESTKSCSAEHPSDSFAVNSGGRNLVSTKNNINFDDDSEKLGAASLYTNVSSQWGVSRFGIFYNNPNGPQMDKVQSSSQFTKTSDSELYQNARISPNSLRYYGLGMANGSYTVELHFAEIQMDDSTTVSWKGLARRLFDVHIQGQTSLAHFVINPKGLSSYNYILEGERVLKDFNIQKEAGGSYKVLVKTFKAKVTNTVMDIHLVWAGKGTCCIPFQSTYGPSISAVYVHQDDSV